MGKKNKRQQPPQQQPQPQHQHAEAQSNPVNNVAAAVVDEEAMRKSKKRKKSKTGGDNAREEEKAVQNHEIENKTKTVPSVSIAIPASIIDNAQSLELATRLAGQIARAATIYKVDEIVVFDNNGTSLEDPLNVSSSDENESNAAFFMRILRYLETPQYLRKALFPRHYNLRFVGMLPPLDAPHHLRKHEWASYREGVTLGEKSPNSGCTLVDVGLSKNVLVDQVLGPGIRVTVAMENDRNLTSGVLHQVVSSSTPKQEEGMYWGYKVRYAPNLCSVFENSPHEGSYDFVIGTSEHGEALKSSELCISAFRHLLIAFGGLAGLEECIKEDKKLKGKGAREVFPTYLNLCPNQGSRTIRTEEAIFISLQYFQEPISRALQKG